MDHGGCHIKEGKRLIGQKSHLFREVIFLLIRAKPQGIIFVQVSDWFHATRFSSVA